MRAEEYGRLRSKSEEILEEKAMDNCMRSGKVLDVQKEINPDLKE